MSSSAAVPGQNRSPHSVDPLPNTPTVPPKSLKRSEAEVQFISCKPVKRRKVSEEKYESVEPPAQQLICPAHTHEHPSQLQYQGQHQYQQKQQQYHQSNFQSQPHSKPVHGPMMSPIMAVAPMAPTPGIEHGNGMDQSHDRRVSTGMVGLPSDFHDLEPYYETRGVSLPVLEDFVLDQPLRRPKPLSSPALSPKQLPGSTPTNFLDDNAQQNGANKHHEIHEAPNSTARFSVTGDPIKPSSTGQAPVTPKNNIDEMDIDTPIMRVRSQSPATAMPLINSASSMPPPPNPRNDDCGKSDCRTQITPITPSNVNRSLVPKQPCRYCVQMQQMRQAALARSQGMPMLNPNVPAHVLPQMPYHPLYSPHSHAPLMNMNHAGMQGFGLGFSPMVMPMNVNGYGGPMQQGGAHHVPQTTTQPSTTTPTPAPPRHSPKSGDSTQITVAAPNTKPTATNASSGPLKPPASLIQPTYRKPSPNLIVDVAETCQEKFPFDEVAKRHKVPVEKVFDVFAAIIQVPLLRCATDRRRPGKVATMRVKEYTRTKHDIKEAHQVNGSKKGSSVTPFGIAQRMGPAQLP